MASVVVNIISRADNSGFARASKAMTKLTAATAALAPATAAASQAVAVLATATASIGALAVPALAVVAAGFEGIKNAAKVAQGQFTAFRESMASSFSGATAGFSKLGGVLDAITPQMQGVGRAVTGVFNGLATTVAKNTGGLQKLAAKSAEFVTRLGPGLNTIVEKMIAFGASINVDAIFNLFTQLGTLLKPIANLFTELSAAAGPFGGALGIVGGIITAITPALVQIATVMGPALSSAFITLTPAIEAFAGALATVITAAAPFLPIIAGLVTALVTGLGPALPVIVAGMVGFAIALKAAAAAIGIYKAVATVIRGVTIAWAAVQWVLNAALLANPITWIVIAIVALIAVIVLIATKTTWFQTAWKAMCDAVSAAWNFLWNAIKTIAQIVLDAIMAYIQMWVTVLTTVWTMIQTVAIAVWNGIQAAVAAVVSVLTALWQGFQGIVSAVWNAISAAVSAVAGVIQSAITGAVNTVIGVFNTVRSVGESVWNGIRGFIDGVGNAIQSVIGWVSGLIDKLSSVGGMIGDILPFSGTVPVPGLAAHMTPPATTSPGVVQFAAGYPSVAALGALGGGGIIKQNIDQRTIVQVDGSGIADPQQVANAVAGSIGRNTRTRGLDFSVRLGS